MAGHLMVLEGQRGRATRDTWDRSAGVEHRAVSLRGEELRTSECRST